MLRVDLTGLRVSSHSLSLINSSSIVFWRRYFDDEITPQLITKSHRLNELYFTSFDRSYVHPSTVPEPLREGTCGIHCPCVRGPGKARKAKRQQIDVKEHFSETEPLCSIMLSRPIKFQVLQISCEDLFLENRLEGPGIMLRIHQQCILSEVPAQTYEDKLVDKRNCWGCYLHGNIIKLAGWSFWRCE